jgi:hypothetical protein
MPISKAAKEVGEVITVNSTALGLSFTNIENGLKILLLIISIMYTLDKWYQHRKSNENN